MRVRGAGVCVGGGVRVHCGRCVVQALLVVQALFVVQARPSVRSDRLPRGRDTSSSSNPLVQGV